MQLATSKLCGMLERVMAGATERFSEAENRADVVEMAKAFVDTKLLLDALEAQVKEFKSQLFEGVRTQRVPQMLEAAGVSNIPLEHYGYRVGVTTRLYASMVDPDGGKAWLKSNGLGDIVLETVNAQTLAKTAKELAEIGRELPDDLFNVHYRDNTSMTRIK